ncbi:hypothetical protein [Natrarchaeobaculum sulfurireducens]|uniref:Uncharacterized protein n=1 Tax=Natrarchaeobaculum sulfurireducens TaxID=2044521 RepID=A0A346PMP9_9EURY|nr:hypothetical protein [Natrarchaeobaculum sulfurireducens]AXR80794.1 hypothetical protein AArcMg_0772 [Natrarchaeobaculum sulfurireducens]
MHLTINGSGHTEIVDEQRDGDRWLVAKDVPIVKPTDLSNGYVPEESVRASMNQENTHGGTGWSGTTATLNHPRNLPEFSWHNPARPTGEPVLAANDDVQETLGLGEIEDEYWDGTYIRADIAVNADRAEEMGGEAVDVVDALENNEPLDVSTQYIGAQLPPGEYDGRHRDQAEAIVAPDSLALLPNAPGQCSVEDGCGVNPVSAPLATANGLEITVNTGHTPADVSNEADPTANATEDPVWSGLGGMLRRIAADIEDLKDRGVVGDDGLMRQLSIDINEAIGMWKAHDETMGGDGELPETAADLPDRATVNRDDLSREALLQAAISSNQFTGPFPFDSKSECIDRMEGEVDDAGALCNAWYTADNEGADWPVEYDASANSTETTAAESAVDHDSETDEMNLTGNATSHELRLDLWGDLMADVLEDGDEDMIHVAHRLLASEMPGVDVQTVRDHFDPEEMDDVDTAAVRERISGLADTINNPGSNKDDDYYNTANMDREDLIEEITANSNIKRESLEGMGDTCLQTTHESIVANDGDGPDDGTDTTTDDVDPDAGADDDDDVDADTDSDTIVVDKSELESLIDEQVEKRVAANEQRRTKEQRVESIVANSAEYDADDKAELMETPDSVLENIERGIGSSFQMPASTGPDAGPTANTGDDVDDTDVDLGTGVID